MAFFSAIEPLRVANRLAGKALYAWRIYSVREPHVEASNGMRILADAVFGEGWAPTLIVCAGFAPERAETRAILAQLRRLSRDGVRLGALDTGAHLLARAGLLSGMRACIHWEAAAAFQEQFPDVVVSDEIYELQERVFTCAGGTASLDLMLAIIRGRHGNALAAAVSEQFLHDRIRGSTDPQRMDVSARLRVHDPKVAAAIRRMQASIEHPLRLDEIARSVGITRRHLERLFRSELGCSPARHHRDLRLARARELLRQSTMPVVQVAVATGFGSSTALSRCYRQRYGCSPHGDRIEPGMA